ncbi:helix-turn-helix transcriptional regulator (plasmid) [Rhizobium sp. TH2]|uniref:helix-turn-helix domain-containing protein n=1 Tax=Rhizobium sp. TH2 TaxID=2775403 RepID=UPI002158839A|nr:helix-turn-helix transcriptional regulator [Rhizobium sp. TH2]UVC12660.1 helix-turn-helix transcriptional regulator [Rhizobium sp. TH2]
MEARQLLAWNVRKIRVERQISQERLALDAGIDRAYYGRVERGEENLSLATVDTLARALSLPVAALFRIPELGEEEPQTLKAGRKKLK